MNTQAANAWLILNDADAVETKMLATMNRVLGDYANLEMFMSRLTTTAAFHDAVLRVGMQNGSIERSVENIIRHTLESAEVMIHDDFRAYGPPRIAVRFRSPQGATFVIQPKVMR
jgi:hypothetical protein